MASLGTCSLCLLLSAHQHHRLPCPEAPQCLHLPVLGLSPRVPPVPSAPLAKTALTACPAPSVLPVPVDGVVNPALR